MGLTDVFQVERVEEGEAVMQRFGIGGGGWTMSIQVRLSQVISRVVMGLI